jgi:hypothetical protein
MACQRLTKAIWVCMACQPVYFRTCSDKAYPLWSDIDLFQKTACFESISTGFESIDCIVYSRAR